MKKKSLASFGAALTLALVASGPAQAATPPVQSGAGALATYLAANGDHFHTTYNSVDYPDYGLTLDGVFGLNAANVASTESRKALSYVGANIKSYISYGSSKYAGATAKALIAVQAVRPGAKGVINGVNLVSRLKSLETSSGRFSDTGGDYSNTFSQSFALIALSRSGVKLSAKSVGFLKKQQCPNGGFRNTESGAACTNGSTADPDATAMGMQALLVTPSSADRAKRLKRAAAYLTSKQQASGGVKGSEGTANTNTTGIAVPAMKFLGYKSFVSKAQKFLRSMQYRCDASTDLQGLFAYDADAKAAGLAGGPTATPVDKDLRATPAGLLGLSGTRYKTVSVKGDSTATPNLGCTAR